MVAAVVFDLDGTLVDSEAVALGTALEVFAAHGAPLDAAFFHDLVGLDDASAHPRIAAVLPAGVAFETVYGAWRQAIRARFVAEGVPLKPGALALLDLLRARGLPLAIATSSQRQSAEFKLGHAGIAGYFQAVVVRESIQNPKPAPDPYLEAARLLAVDPQDCIAFEDSVLGARSARAAGMRLVQIPDVAHPAAHEIDWPLAPDLLSGARALGLID